MTGSGDYTGTVYISEPSSSWDSAAATAEGMPVFGVATLNPACAVVGNTVTVVGNVVESTSVVPADVTASNTPGTGLVPTSCTVAATGGAMTQSISLGATLNSFGRAQASSSLRSAAPPPPSPSPARPPPQARPASPRRQPVTLSAAATIAVPITTTTSIYTGIGYTGIGRGLGPWALLLSMFSAAAIFVRRRQGHIPRLAAAVAILGLMGLANLGCSGRTPAQDIRQPSPASTPIPFPSPTEPSPTPPPIHSP